MCKQSQPVCSPGVLGIPAEYNPGHGHRTAAIGHADHQHDTQRSSGAKHRVTSNACRFPPFLSVSSRYHSRSRCRIASSLHRSSSARNTVTVVSPHDCVTTVAKLHRRALQPAACSGLASTSDGLGPALQLFKIVHLQPPSMMAKRLEWSLALCANCASLIPAKNYPYEGDRGGPLRYAHYLARAALLQHPRPENG